MKYLQYLQEEYFTSVLDYDYDIPIYKNPTKDDTKAISQGKYVDVRIVIDMKNKNIYIWNAYDAVHMDGLKALEKEGLNLNKNSAWRIFCDEGSIKGGKLYGDFAIPYKRYMLFYGKGDPPPPKKSDYQQDVSWLNKYFTYTPRIEKEKNEPVIVF